MSTLARSIMPLDGTHQHGDLLRSASPEQSTALGRPSHDAARPMPYPAAPGASNGRGTIPSPTSPPNPKRTPTRLTRVTSAKDGLATAKDIKTPIRTSQSSLPFPSSPTGAAIDPLSQHILMRTNTENAGSPRLRHPTRPDSPGPDVLQRLVSDATTKLPAPAPVDIVKDKRKSASFLSRLSMRGRKKDGFHDDDSEVGEPRLSGSEARVFSSSIAAGGYLPRHKEPPRYIKVRAHGKKRPELNRIFLAQQLSTLPSSDDAPENQGSGKARPPGTGAVWAMNFSKDGKYLAAAGKDQTVRIWSVISTPEERREHEEEESADKATEERLSAPVFRSKPCREFVGHSGEVLDLSWSKNNFLLSSSMDKTVRLWHISREECLCTFKHKDFVTSIAFHPTDDRFFLAGSLDAQLRLWSIPDKSIAFTAQLPDLVTAVAFSPDGKVAIGGVLSGTCLFYETEGLKLLSQMHVRSSRGKNSKGSKITGIQTIAFPPGSSNGDVKVLVTSNDSRVRLYNMKDRSLEMKCKGHQNIYSQVRASFSDDARYIICGSEDKRAFLWSLQSDDADARDKTPYECFDAHSVRVSATAMAPTRTRQLLSASGDPLYDLCNPPPVKLLSLEESFAATQADASSLPPPTPQEAPKQSPAYLERSKHGDGNIIVTADHDGVIKVFRQDCAFVKRRHEVWETGSNFSRQVVGEASLLGRSGSIITRTSASSHPRSRRTSLSQPTPSSAAQGPHMTSERINSWRHGIDSGRNSHRSSLIGAGSIRSERSTSPSRLGKAQAVFDVSGLDGASDEHKKPPPLSILSAPRQRPRSPTTTNTNTLRGAKRSGAQDTASQPPTPSFSFRPVPEDDEPRFEGANANSSFWNLSRWPGLSAIRSSSLSPSTGFLTPRTASMPAAIQTLAHGGEAGRKNDPGDAVGTSTRALEKQPGRATQSNARSCRDEDAASPGGWDIDGGSEQECPLPAPSEANNVDHTGAHSTLDSASVEGNMRPPR